MSDILQRCTKNEDHVMYGSWNTRRNRQNFLSFLAIFCPFTSLMIHKIKIWKIKNSNWRYYHFTHVQHEWQSYDIWFLKYGVFFCNFGPFFALSLSYGPPKNEKSTWRHYRFNQGYSKYNHILYSFWDMEHGRQSFCYFWTLFVLLTNLKIKILKKWKKRLEILSFNRCVL